jgi:hypothetical protein
VRANEEVRPANGEWTHNFGTIDASVEAVSHTFILRNTGDKALVISRVTASCGCTRPAYSGRPIAPGDTGRLTVTFHPEGSPGPFYKTLAIYSNHRPQAYKLAIQGEVVPTPPVVRDTLIRSRVSPTKSIAPVRKKHPSFFRRLFRRF